MIVATFIKYQILTTLFLHVGNQITHANMFRDNFHPKDKQLDIELTSKRGIVL